MRYKSGKRTTKVESELQMWKENYKSGMRTTKEEREIQKWKVI